MTVLRAERIGGADSHRLQCVLDLAAQRDWLAKLHEAAKGSFAVGSRRVDENSRHRTIFLGGRPTVQALPNTGGGVAALQGDLAHESV